MLEQLFNDPAAVERWRAGLLGPHLDVFVRTATNLGYTRTSLKGWFVVLGDLQGWLGCHALGVADLE